MCLIFKGDDCARQCSRRLCTQSCGIPRRGGGGDSGADAERTQIVAGFDLSHDLFGGFRRRHFAIVRFYPANLGSQLMVAKYAGDPAGEIPAAQMSVETMSRLMVQDSAQFAQRVSAAGGSDPNRPRTQMRGSLRLE